MGLTHHKTVCSCGAVISQCRCMSPGKTLIVKTNACAACKAAFPQPTAPAFVTHIPAGTRVTQATHDATAEQTHLQLAAPNGQAWTLILADADLRLVAGHAGVVIPAGAS